MGNNETTPKTGMVLQVKATDIFPYLFSDCFSLVLHLAKVSVTTGSMRQFLDPTEVAWGIYLWCVSLFLFSNRFLGVFLSSPTLA